MTGFLLVDPPSLILFYFIFLLLILFFPSYLHFNTPSCKCHFVSTLNLYNNVGDQPPVEMFVIFSENDKTLITDLAAGHISELN